MENIGPGRSARLPLIVTLVAATLAAAACGDTTETTDEAGAGLAAGAVEATAWRLPTDEEICALMTAEDLPGDAFRVVPESTSVGAEMGGRTAATSEAASDPNAKDGLVPADASCSWVGDSGIAAGLSVLDYSDRPDLLALPVEDLLIGRLAEEHPVVDLDGWDRMVVTDPTDIHAFAAGSVGPYVVTANAAFFVDGGQELAVVFLERLLGRWLAAATEPS